MSQPAPLPLPGTADGNHWVTSQCVVTACSAGEEALVREQLLGWGAEVRAEVLVWQEGTSAGEGSAVPACAFRCHLKRAL